MSENKPANLNIAAEELRQLLQYDDRAYPKWHGHIGYITFYSDAVVVSRSWADPREGCNLERLQIEIGKNCGVRLTGYDDNCEPLNYILDDVDYPDALERLLSAARNGTRHMRGLAGWIRDPELYNLRDGICN